ncbi:MAG: Ig-like domain-containing protein, partial [Bifidobacteriaceae bacterium]|nr:Ig-like domain-containing protein [Bifidobacteriaceae bacterium]
RRRPAASLAALAAASACAIAAQGLVVAAPAQAATVAFSNPIAVDCDTLYSAGTTRVYSYDLSNQSARQVELAARSSALPSGFGSGITTMAIGYQPAEAGGDGLLHTYLWAWNGDGLTIDVPNGQSVGSVFRVPMPPSTEPAASRSGYSGGEVNQLTGEIYFSGYEDTYLSASFRMLRYNPIDGTAVHSGAIRPKTESDRLTGSAGKVSSDMAVDAEGNVYVIAGTGTGVKWLVRIVPGREGEWTYSRVVRITWGSTTFSGSDMWGLAFLDGTLYVALGGTVLWRLDPISGVAARIKTGLPDSRDLATCQTAPVARGTVYQDRDGDGVIAGDADPGLAGVSIELYDADARRLDDPANPRVTDGAGGYSYILNSASSDFYVRVRQPQVPVGAGAVNAAQTWAGVSEGVANPVTAYCATGQPGGDLAEQTRSGPCRGARADGIDASNGVNGALAERALIFSKVHVTTSTEVAVADFAVTGAASHGDAPATFGTAVADAGPSHLAGSAARAVWLGPTVTTSEDGQPSADADADPGDDGVFIELGGAEVPLGEAIVVAGRTYPIRVAVSGPSASLAQVTGWIAPLEARGAAPTRFPSAPFMAGQPGPDGALRGTWTVPATAPAGPTGSVYARFRVATAAGLGSTDIPPYPPAPGGASADSLPWRVDGEVEDYRVQVATGAVRLSAVTRQRAGGPFQLRLGNVSGAAPSSDTESLTTEAPDQVARSTATHLIAAAGTPVEIALASAPLGWAFDSAACAADGAPLAPSVAPHSVVIEAADVEVGRDIACELAFRQVPNGLISSFAAADAEPRTADGRSAHTLTATVRAADGAALAGAHVAFEIDPAAGAELSAPDCVTGSRGECPVRVTAAAAGRYSVWAWATGAAGVPEPLGAGPATVDFAAGPPDQAQSQASATTGPRRADGADRHTVTLVLRDANANPVTGAAASIQPAAQPAGGVTFEGVRETAGAPGEYTFTVASTWAGPVQVTAGHDGLDWPLGAVTALFEPGPPAYGPGQTELTGTDGWVRTTGGGESYHEAVVVVRDAQGNPVPGAPVELALAGVGTLAPGSSLGGLTDAAGRHAIRVVSASRAGMATVTARAGEPGAAATADITNGGAAPAGLVLHFVSGVVSPADSRFELGAGGARLADGVAQHSVTVTLRDSNGTAVDSQVDAVEIAVSGTGGLGSGGASPFREVADGVYEATVTSTVAGAKSVAVRWAGVEIALADPSSPGTIVFEAGAVAPGNSDFSVSRTPRVVADGQDGNSQWLTVVLRDAFSNPIPAVRIDPADLAAEALLASDAAVSARVGPFEAAGPEGEFRARVTSTVAGVFAVAVGFQGVSVPVAPGAGGDTQFVAGPADPGASRLAVPGTPVEAGQTVEATVEARDATGNPVGGVGVRLWTEPPIDLPGGGLATTSAAGQAVVALSTVAAGVYAVHAEIAGAGELPGQPPAAVFQAGAPDPTLSRLTGSSGTRVADGVGFHAAVATVLDRHGNPVVGAGVEFEIAGVGVLAPGQDAAGLAGENGDYGIRLVSPARLGQARVTARVGRPGEPVATALTNGGAGPAELSLAFAAGEPDPAKSSLTLSREQAAAGETVLAAVTVRDASGNPVGDVPVDIRTNSETALPGGEAVTDASGEAAVALATVKAGSYQIEAWIRGQDGQVGGSPAPLAFGPGAIDLARTTLSGSVDRVVLADGVATHSVSARVVDAHANPVSGATVDFAVAGAGRLAPGQTAAGTVDAAGRREVTIVSAAGVGEAVVTARVRAPGSTAHSDITNGGTGPASLSLPFTAGDPDPANSTLALAPASVTAGGPATAGVQVNDQAGNPVGGVPVRVWTAPALDLPGDGRAVTDAAGR